MIHEIENNWRKKNWAENLKKKKNTKDWKTCSWKLSWKRETEKRKSEEKVKQWPLWKVEEDPGMERGRELGFSRLNWDLDFPTVWEGSGKLRIVGFGFLSHWSGTLHLSERERERERQRQQIGSLSIFDSTVLQWTLSFFALRRYIYC